MTTAPRRNHEEIGRERGQDVLILVALATLCVLLIGPLAQQTVPAYPPGPGAAPPAAGSVRNPGVPEIAAGKVLPSAQSAAGSAAGAAYGAGPGNGESPPGASTPGLPPNWESEFGDTRPFAPTGRGPSGVLGAIFDEGSDALGSGLGLWADDSGTYRPPIIGDMSPLLPPLPPGGRLGYADDQPGGRAEVPGLVCSPAGPAGLKIADNQSPIPQDRFFYSFNYFDNVNSAINQRLGGQIRDVKRPAQPLRR